MAVAVLVGGLGFVAGSMTAADASPQPVTKAQVKKIAAKQAKRAITKAAPTLEVAHADSADTAATAATADLATDVVNQRVKPFGLALPENSSETAIGTVSGMSLTGACVAGDPRVYIAAPSGKFRMASFLGTSLTFNGDGDLGVLGKTEIVSSTVAGSAVIQYVSGAGQAATADLGWRSDGTGCQIFGTLAG